MNNWTLFLIVFGGCFLAFIISNFLKEVIEWLYRNTRDAKRYRAKYSTTRVDYTIPYGSYGTYYDRGQINRLGWDIRAIKDQLDEMSARMDEIEDKIVDNMEERS